MRVRHIRTYLTCTVYTDGGKAYGGISKSIRRLARQADQSLVVTSRLVMFRGDLRDARRGAKGFLRRTFFSFFFRLYRLLSVSRHRQRIVER